MAIRSYAVTHLSRLGKNQRRKRERSTLTRSNRDGDNQRSLVHIGGK